MPDYQKIIEQKQKRDLERQKRSEERMRKKFEAGGGVKRQKELQEKLKADKGYFNNKQQESFSRLGVSTPETETVPSLEEKIEAGRELYKEKLAEQRAEPGEAASAEEEITAEGEEGERGVRGSWNRLKARLGNLKEEREGLFEQMRSGAMARQAAQQAVKQSILRAWQIVHEVVEDLAFSFVDLMILTGPLAFLVFLARLVGSTILRGFFTFNIRGVEVQVVPFFGQAELVPRVAKNLLILVIAGFIWFVIFLLVYAATHKCSVVGYIVGGDIAENIFGFLCKTVGVE